jgi:hypothetical protein
MIQNSSTVLRMLLWILFGPENVNKVFKDSVSELRRFYFDVSFIIVILDFYEVKTICFNICQVSSLFAIKERNTALRKFYQSSLFCTFLIVCGDLLDFFPLLVTKSANCASNVCTFTNW